MRWPVAAVFAAALLGATLAGCLGDVDVEPGVPLASGDAEDRARGALKEESGDVTLIAAFGVASMTPGNLAVSPDHPGLAALAARVLARPAAVPGDGTLPAWAYLYESADGGRVIGAVVTSGVAAGANDSVLPDAEGDGVWVRSEPIDRAELALLRANRTLQTAPAVDSTGALQAALGVGAWADVARSAGAFILFVLSADDAGAPVWRIIAAPPEGPGLFVLVNGATGERLGPAAGWPEAAITGADQARFEEGDGLSLPGDEQVFPFTVPAGTAELHVRANRTSTLGPIEPLAPAVRLVDPAGTSIDLELNVAAAVQRPAPGEWQVIYSWDLVDFYRIIRVSYCSAPQPFLFAEDAAACSALS